MEFIQHTENWVRGENFEGILVFIAGLVLITSALLFWKMGTTPNAKSLVIPLLVLGLLFSVGISALYLSNKARIVAYQTAYTRDAAAFVHAEKDRVEGFQSIYTYSAVFSGLCFLIAIGAFLGTQNRTFQSIAIALVILGGALILIDFFSKERSQIYYTEIVRELSTPTQSQVGLRGPGPESTVN